jgi:shikimate dehydrogenase
MTGLTDSDEAATPVQRPRPRQAWPTVNTALAGVIGHPVDHSLSPILHNAAFSALGVDWAYVAFEVPPALFEAAMMGAAALGLRGLSVTMPHKNAAARLANRRSANARRLGSANTLVFDERGIYADSTDGEGLLDDLRLGAGFDPADRKCGVIGAGGGARAAVLALAAAGAAEVIVVNRTPAAAWRAAALAPVVARVGRAEELGQLDLIVQATPMGMEKATSVFGGSRTVAGVDPTRFGAGQLVVDLVYDPPMTEFLEIASAAGATVRNGVGMLVHQAARQITLWTGLDAPLRLMWAALDAVRVTQPEP